MKRIVLLILVLGLQQLQAEDISIKKLKSKADDYLNTSVTIEAELVKHDSIDDDILEAKKAQFFDKSNDTIEVSFKEKEELEYGAEYELEGKLKRNKEGVLFIKAEEFDCMDCEEDEEEESNTMLFVLIGMAVVIIGLLLAIVLKKGKKAPKTDPLEKYTRSQTEPSSQNNPAPAASQGREDYSTIAFNVSDLPGKKQEPASPAKTVVMQKPTQMGQQAIPGKFAIVAGAPPKNDIELLGNPSSLGAIATIGREAASQGEEQTHLHIPHNTVSRRQAELIFKDGRVFIKNLSSTNPTRLGEQEMKVGEELPLNNAAVISLGTVLVRYTV